MIWAVSVSSGRYVVREGVSAYLLGGSEVLDSLADGGGWRGRGSERKRESCWAVDIPYGGMNIWMNI